MKMDTRSGENIVLVGMPGVGKSTVGVLLAKRLRYSFIDTDIHIQTRMGLKLQEIIDQKGLDRFCEIEEQSILSLSCSEHVIATGGSVVYSEKAMKHLNKNGRVCHMDLDPQRLRVRLDNINSRGIVMAPGQSIETLYAERHPLYMKYADFTVDCADMTPNEVLKTMLKAL
jgi:shikimate kinase